MLKRFIAASLALCAGSVALFELDPTLKYELDSDNYRWVGQAIFDPDVEIGTAFVGTSRTWTAVDTSRIARERPEDRPINLGTNWHGRQARWVVIRDLLASKRVERLVVEIYHQEEEDAHPYSRFLGSVFDPPLNQPVPAKQLLSDVTGYYLGAGVRGYYLWYRRLVHGNFHDWRYPGWDQSRGHHTPSTTPEELERFWASIAPEAPRYDVYDDDGLRIREGFLARVSELCRARGVALYFLFVPARNGPLPSPRFLDVLRKYGTPIDLPIDGLYEARLWRDPTHFDDEGTRIFTERLLASPLYAQ
ncbi:hypothetical protein L6R52_12615 [Myxococcota bacterium]|nr:hypothetical protein [Myxococcota bacterium]